MKHLVSVALYVLSAVSTCYAQVPCDSIYGADDRFKEGKIGLILFDVPPKVTFGMEKLNNYTGSKDKTGIVVYRVVIDDVGNVSCLKFSGTTNKLLVDEATSIAESLRFAPALLHGKAIRSTMYVTVRFYQDKPKKRHGKKP